VDDPTRGPQGQTHWAGSEVDFGWIDTGGDPQNTSFYEVLPGRQRAFRFGTVRGSR
jgi:hypothetical protein